MEQSGIGNSLDCLVRQKIEEIMDQREEVLRAFIAKHGFEPDRAIQVEQRMPDGTTRWFVRRRTDEEMANDSLDRPAASAGTVGGLVGGLNQEGNR